MFSKWHLLRRLILEGKFPAVVTESSLDTEYIEFLAQVFSWCWQGFTATLSVFDVHQL